jgi:hypothetical protein
MTDIISPSPYAYLGDLPPTERQAAIARRQHERREDWCDDASRARDYQARIAELEQSCVNADEKDKAWREQSEEDSVIIDKLGEEICLLRDDLDAALARIAELEAALENIAEDCAADFPPSYGAIKYAARTALRNR